MAIAVFANKSFTVNADKIYTFNEFQYSSSLQTEKQDKTGSKPSTYNKGPDLDNISFKIKLDVTYGVNPRQEWEDWKTLMETAVAYPFILGGKPLGSYNWLLVGVNPSNVNINNVGKILSMELELKFDEYARAGSAETSKSNSKKSNGTTLQGLSNDEIGSLIDG